MPTPCLSNMDESGYGASTAKPDSEATWTRLLSHRIYYRIIYPSLPFSLCLQCESGAYSPRNETDRQSRLAYGRSSLSVFLFLFSIVLLPSL